MPIDPSAMTLLYANGSICVVVLRKIGWLEAEFEETAPKFPFLISFVAAALLSENWSDFAHISFWFYFDCDIVTIKAENNTRTCACQGIVAMIQYSFQFVASKMAETSSQHDARCKRCGTCECHLLLSRLYWFDYSCWVSLVMIGKDKWLRRFVLRLSRSSTIYDIYHLMATHVRRSLHSWEACLQRGISPTFNNQSGEGHIGFSELALCDVVQRRPLWYGEKEKTDECQRILRKSILISYFLL
jgi:hypothetical protein